MSTRIYSVGQLRDWLEPFTYETDLQVPVVAEYISALDSGTDMAQIAITSDPSTSVSRVKADPEVAS